MNVDLASLTSVKSSPSSYGASESIAPGVDETSTRALNGNTPAKTQSESLQSFAKAYSSSSSKESASAEVDALSPYGVGFSEEMLGEFVLETSEGEGETEGAFTSVASGIEEGVFATLPENWAKSEGSQPGNASTLTLTQVATEQSATGETQHLSQASASAATQPNTAILAADLTQSVVRPTDLVSRLVSETTVERSGLAASNAMLQSATVNQPSAAAIGGNAILAADYSASITTGSTFGNLSLQQFQQMLQGGVKHSASSTMPLGASLEGSGSASGQSTVASTDATGLGQLTHSAQAAVRANTSSVWGPLSLPANGDMTQFGKEMLLPLRDQFRFSVEQGIKKAELRLDPPELGRVEMTIRQDGDRISVQLNAANPIVREALASGAERLRAEMTQGFSEQVSVDVGQGDARSDAEPEQFKSADILVAVESEQEFTELSSTSSSDLVNTLA